MCGENICYRVRYGLPKGSPPRVRGKLFIKALPPSCIRITPACAGKTPTERRKTHEQQDHPRVCGENFPGVPSVKATVGSPPRVRGKLCIKSSLSCIFRITPACAGKTCTEPLLKHGREDHPRVCGENSRTYTVKKGDTGSPPRVRGKPVDGVHRVREAGITPACAGKTRSRR